MPVLVPIVLAPAPFEMIPPRIFVIEAKISHSNGLAPAHARKREQNDGDAKGAEEP